MDSEPQRGPSETWPEAEIRARLARELPRWEYADGAICRRYRAHGWKGAMMVANAVAHLAEAAFHHPDLEISWGAVLVKLRTHSAKGVTNKDFELARRIEELVLWRPERERGALEGTPDDPRYAYLKYD
jgi:4a-hydroxytetrahydrobiopterin dehydratase